MRSVMRRSAQVALIASLLAAGPVAVASNDQISENVVGGLCVPDSRTVREGIYETAGFGVRIANDRVGKVRLLCPFHDMSASFRTIIGIEITYLDSDGRSRGGHIRAQLRTVGVQSNAMSTVGSCESEFPSTVIPDLSPHRSACLFRPRHQKIPRNSYWFEIEIEKTDPKVNVEFLGVRSLHEGQ